MSRSAELLVATAQLELLGDAAAGYAVHAVDLSGHVASWNTGAQRSSGYRTDEILGQHISVFYAPEDLVAGKPARDLAIATQAGRHAGDCWRVRKDGTRFWASVLIATIRDPGGDQVGFATITHDVTERLQAPDLLRLVLEGAPTGMIMVDAHGQIRLVNARIESLFGYPRAELVGRPLDMLLPERLRGGHHRQLAGFFADPRSRVIGRGRDLLGRRVDGSEIPIEIALSPLTTPEGEFVVGSVADITDRKRAERERASLLEQLRLSNTQLSAAIGERDVLLQEVHHRVNNNLQVISSMINLQLRQLRDTGGRHALVECQTRVQAIALVHEQLYRSRDHGAVPFSEYARRLATSVFQAIGTAPGSIRLELAMADVALTIDKAIPCGLIMNELITNSLKHAFPGERPGTLRVSLERDGEAGIRLMVKDDGIGLPDGFDMVRSDSLGLQLIRILADQLDGTLTCRGDHGAEFTLAFRVAP